MSLKSPHLFHSFEPKRDTYGFTVRPHHLQRYREYANIYKEEEAERSHKWNTFLNSQEVSVQQQYPSQEVYTTDNSETRNHTSIGDDSHREKPLSDIHTTNLLEKEVETFIQPKNREVKTWTNIRSSLFAIETMMAFRVKNKSNMKGEQLSSSHDNLPPIGVSNPSREETEDKDDESSNVILNDSSKAFAEGRSARDGVSAEPSVPWKDELELLVHGGVPRYLRGEVWQAFIGVKARRAERYYQVLSFSESDIGPHPKNGTPSEDNSSTGCNSGPADVSDKWRKQIEKVIRCMGPGIYHSIF